MRPVAEVGVAAVAGRSSLSRQEKAMDGNARGKLLLVEDETVLRRLVAEYLRSEGFEVIEAADGLEGTSLYAGHRPFDLVLLDLNLPYLSGVDVCRRIKAVQPDQPVLICSAAILDRHVTELLELRVDQFLTKPYHPLDLLHRIAKELARRSPTDAPARPAPAASSAPTRRPSERDRWCPTLFNFGPLG
jgi:DNA-binding response OmpR family regulator